MDRVSKVVRCSVSLSSGIPVEDISDDTVISDTGMTSLDMMETLLEIEQELDVEILPGKSRTIETVGDLEAAVRRGGAI